MARPRELLPFAVLVLLMEAPCHGYVLIERVAESLRWDVSNRAYRILRSLEEAGLVSSTWDMTSDPGPARRVYAVTADGRRAVEVAQPAIEDLAEFLTTILNRACHISRANPAPPTPRRRPRSSRSAADDTTGPAKVR